MGGERGEIGEQLCCSGRLACAPGLGRAQQRAQRARHRHPILGRRRRRGNERIKVHWSLVVVAVGHPVIVLILGRRLRRRRRFLLWRRRRRAEDANAAAVAILVVH